MTPLELLADGWALSQSGLLTTRDLIKRAEAYGFELRPPGLESLCRQRLLVPLIAVHDDQVGQPVESGSPPRHSWDRARLQLDLAAQQGRLTDPATTSLPDGWRFDDGSAGDERNWWNGLVYSRWQLLHLARLRGLFTMQGQPILRDGKWPAFPENWATDDAQRSRELAILLSAIEPRYLPVVDDGWVRLRNASHEEWRAYRDSFEPNALARQCSVTAAGVRTLAEQQLLSAKSLDPLGPWARLVRHAKPSYQEKLKGIPLLCVDLRTAAEMLLRFAEELGEPIPTGDAAFYHPVNDRLSRHGTQLDVALQEVGVSPHTRVALIVEGETEVLLVRRILEHLGHGPTPAGLDVIPMRGVRNKERIMRLAAHLATPIVTDSYPDRYHTLRPLCRVVVATDPEAPMDQPAEFKTKLITLIRQGLEDQGIDDVDPESLEWLVTVETWGQSFEFEHFTDTEIAEALLQLDPCPLPRGSTLKSAQGFVASARRARRSPADPYRGRISSTHSVTDPQARLVASTQLTKHASRLSKTALADKLWPLLREKIDAAIRDDVEAPPLVGVVYEAHLMASDAMERNWTLSRLAEPEPTA